MFERGLTEPVKRVFAKQVLKEEEVNGELDKAVRVFDKLFLVFKDGRFASYIADEFDDVCGTAPLHLNKYDVEVYDLMKLGLISAPEYYAELNLECENNKAAKIAAKKAQYEELKKEFETESDK